MPQKITLKWSLILSPLIPLFIALLFLFHETLNRLIKGWFTWESSHGILVLSITLYMVWAKREVLRRLPQSSNLFLGGILTILGCLMFLSGKISSTLLLQDISLVIVILGLIWLICGSKFFKILSLPLGYLFFMFPLFEEVFGSVSIYLQYATAWIAFGFLKIWGLPVVLSNQFIELPHISLEVARGCNGINHIMALTALAVPLAYATQPSWLKKVSLIFSAILIGVLANGLRVGVIGIWTAYYKGSSLHGPYDIFYVSFIFFFGMAILILLSHIMGKPISFGYHNTTSFEQKSFNLGNLSRSSNIPAVSNTTISLPSTLSGSEELLLAYNARPVRVRSPQSLRLTSFIVAFGILLATSGYLRFFPIKPITLQKPLSSFPTNIGNWRGLDSNQKDMLFRHLTADKELNRIYLDALGNRVELYIGYFEMQKQDKKMITYHLDWIHQEAEVIPIKMDRGNWLEIKRTGSPKNNDLRIFYFWYEINGKIFKDRYGAKMATILEGLSKQRTNGAIIIIKAEKKSSGSNSYLEFIKEAIPLIKEALN